MLPLTRSQMSKLSPAELIIELGKRGIKAFDGSDLKGRTTCPHCGHEGPIERDFGIRVMRGSIWPQSWCRTCRTGKK